MTVRQTPTAFKKKTRRGNYYNAKKAYAFAEIDIPFIYL